VLALVGVVAGALFWLPEPAPDRSGPRPCQATFGQVREGMTFDEVCATVGGPPGNYFHRPERATRYQGLADGEHAWHADDGNLLVIFDVHGRATMVIVEKDLRRRDTKTRRQSRLLGP
jgi:hypothetical protein